MNGAMRNVTTLKEKQGSKKIEKPKHNKTKIPQSQRII